MLIVAEAVTGMSALVEFIKLVGTLGALAIGGYISVQLARIKLQQDAQAVEVKAVKTTLVDTTQAQAATQAEQLNITRETHSLVNGMTTANLSLIADMADEACRDNPNNKAYAERAKQRRQAYDEHVARIKAAAIQH